MDYSATCPDDTDPPCLYKDLLTEILFRCDISALQYLYTLPEERRTIPSPLFGYTLGNFQTLLQEEKVISVLCVYYALPQVKTFPDFQLAFDRQYLFREKCSNEYRHERWSKSFTYKQVSKRAVQAGLIDFYQEWSQRERLSDCSRGYMNRYCWPIEKILANKNFRTEYFYFACKLGQDVSAFFPGSSDDRYSYLQSIIHHQRWEYLPQFTDAEINEFCEEFPRTEIQDGLYELVFRPRSFIPVEHQHRFANHLFEFYESCSREELLQVIRRTRITGYSLRIYRGLQLTREEVEIIIAREYAERKSHPLGTNFCKLLAFAEGYECLDFLRELGLEKIHFLFYDLSLGRKVDTQEVLVALEENRKLPFNICLLRIHFEILFFLHERYEQTTELKRVTFRFLHWLPQIQIDTFREYLFRFLLYYPELRVCLPVLKTIQ